MAGYRPNPVAPLKCYAVSTLARFIFTVRLVRKMVVSEVPPDFTIELKTAILSADRCGAIPRPEHA